MEDRVENVLFGASHDEVLYLWSCDLVKQYTLQSRGAVSWRWKFRCLSIEMIITVMG